MLVITICPEGKHFSAVLLPVLFHSEAAPAFRVSVVIIVERGGVIYCQSACRKTLLSGCIRVLPRNRTNRMHIDILKKGFIMEIGSHGY